LLTPTSVPGLESRITDTALRGDHLWLATEAHGLGVMDVSVPTAPVAVRRYPCPGANQRLADLGDMFYVTTGDDDVALVDLGLEDLNADVTNIGVEIPTADRNAVLVAADLGLGFFVDDAGLLSTIDLSVSGLPTAKSTGDLQLPSTMPMMAELHGTTGLVSTMFGMHVIDLSTPGAPALATTMTLPGGMWPTSVAFDGDTAYVGTIAGGLMIVDLSDPYAPSQLSYFPLGSFDGYLEMFGSSVYAQVGTEIVMIDVSDPALPAEVGRFEAEIEGSLLYGRGYVAVIGDGLRMLDVTDPWAPVIVARHDLVGSAQSLQLHFENLMLYVRDVQTLRVFDLSYPLEPVMHGAYPGGVSRFSGGGADLLVVSGGNLYRTPKDCGYFIIDGVPDGAPRVPRILGAAPNPFNPAVTVAYSLPRTQFVTVTVHDLRGRTIATLVEGVRDEGVQSAVWRGRRDDGRTATSGSYVVRVRTADAVDARKVTLLQ